ncbi:MAG: DUF1385 domain-containing protein [bacterium]
MTEIKYYKKPKIGGVSGRFGVGILYGSKVAFAVRLNNGEIQVFSQIIPPPKWKIFRLPFIRSLMVFRQIFLVFQLSRTNLRKLSKQGLIDLQIKKRIFHALIFLSIYIGSFYFLLPYIFQSNYIIQIVLYIVLFIIFIQLFFYLIMGAQCLKYHGAEHKVINTFFDHKSLTLENAQQHSRLAFRCGTTLAAFLIVLSAIIPDSAYETVARLCGSFGCELLLFIFILGTAYELIEIFSRPSISSKCNSFLSPISKLQYLTTREPSIAELEVALAAIQEAVGWWDRPLVFL